MIAIETIGRISFFVYLKPSNLNKAAALGFGKTRAFAVFRA